MAKAEAERTTVTSTRRNATCNMYRISCRIANGLPPRDAKGKDVLWVNGEKLCRRKVPLAVAAKSSSDDKKRRAHKR